MFPWSFAPLAHGEAFLHILSFAECSALTRGLNDLVAQTIPRQ
jgi:hypothetical protein